MRLGLIAEFLGSSPELVKGADADLEITGGATLDKAGPSEISFIASPAYLSKLANSKAGAIIVGVGMEKDVDVSIPILVVEKPYVAFAKLLGKLMPPPSYPAGISDSADVSGTAVIHGTSTVMANVFVGDGVRVGARTVVMPGVYLGDNTTVGEDCVIHPNSVVGHDSVIGDRVIIHGGVVIGADGFGYVMDGGENIKIPQVGSVVIEDDVEIGGSVTIDRAALDITLVKKGVKLDSQVHIGHNAIIGKNCRLSGNTSVAGSAVLGDGVITGGQAGIAGHIQVGDGVMVGAMTGVIKDAEAGETYMGFPAIKGGEWRRRQVYFGRLPEYHKKVKQLESQLAELSAKVEQLS